MRIYPVVHWVFSGVGMLLLLRVIGVSASGAWLGATTYVFSGVSLPGVTGGHAAEKCFLTGTPHPERC